MKRERPVNFGAEEVRAVLAGWKTQFRRPLRKQPSPTATFHHCDALGQAVFTDNTVVPCPFGTPGDGARLWVRETWAPARVATSHEYGDVSYFEWSAETHGALKRTAHNLEIFYRADGEDSLPTEFSMPYGSEIRWRSPVAMPRWAARLFLDVVSARIQKAQGLTTEDALAEGARHFADLPGHDPYGLAPRWSCEDPTDTDDCLGSAQMAVANLWNRRYGDDAWRRNDWVWAVTFKRVEVA